MKLPPSQVATALSSEGTIVISAATVNFRDTVFPIFRKRKILISPFLSILILNEFSYTINPRECPCKSSEIRPLNASPKSQIVREDLLPTSNKTFDCSLEPRREWENELSLIFPTPPHLSSEHRKGRSWTDDADRDHRQSVRPASGRFTLLLFHSRGTHGEELSQI